MGRYFHDSDVSGHDLCIFRHGICRCAKGTGGIYPDLCVACISADHVYLRSADQKMQYEMAGNICVINQYGRCNDLCSADHSADRVGGAG